MRNFIMCVLVALTLASCQSAGPTLNTPSGVPDVTIKAPAAEVRATLMNALLSSGGLQKGMRIISDTPSQLVFEVPSDNLAANVLLGSRANPTVTERGTFTFVELGGSTRVVATAAFVTNPGTGFEQLTPSTNKQMLAQIQQMLERLAATVEKRPLDSKPTAVVQPPVTAAK